MIIGRPNYSKGQTYDVFVTHTTRGERYVGTVYRANGTIFANPLNSQVQTVPCESWQDAFETCERLAS